MPWVCPTVVGMAWICIFGGNALHMELYADGGPGTAGLMDLANDLQLEAVLYGTIERMSDFEWLTVAMSALATLLLATWFITSSDSGTLVIATLLSLGDDHPPQRFRIVWGVAQGAVAAVLLVVGGLEALQAASVAAALPVSFVMLLMTLGIIKSLAEDPSAASGEAERAE